jgi:hypothetical protein
MVDAHKSLAQQFCSLAISLCINSQNYCVFLRDVMRNATYWIKTDGTIQRNYR